MILATDVQYNNNEAVAAGILFQNMQLDLIVKKITKKVYKIAPYEAGFFYKRELPCILSLLKEIDAKLDIIIIDGYVSLGKDEKDGLGMHLYKKLNCKIPVIGVAKRAYAQTPQKNEILRGKSKNPLYVTAVGMSLEEAQNLILMMHGENRIPTILKKADQLCRGIE